MAAEKGITEAEDRLRSLELTMPAEQWREAQDHIRKYSGKVGHEFESYYAGYSVLYKTAETNRTQQNGSYMTEPFILGEST